MLSFTLSIPSFKSFLKKWYVSLINKYIGKATMIPGTPAIVPPIDTAIIVINGLTLFVLPYTLGEIT